MAAKTIIVNGSTKINVDGLTPAQIKKVQEISTKGGMYGGKGTALAKTFQTQNAKAKTTPVVNTPPVVTPPPTTEVAPTSTPAPTGPGVTPAPIPGYVAPITDQAGVTGAGQAAATGTTNVFLDELANIGKGATGARDSTYSYLTRDFERNKARELEAKKQELAQRGIPLDPTQESLWNKTIGGVEDDYKNQYAAANTQALTVGNQFYNDSVTRASTLGQLGGGFLDSLTQADLTRLGIDQTKFLELKKLEETKQLELKKLAQDKMLGLKSIGVEQQKVNKMGSGGGGGGSSDSGGDIFIG